MEEVEAREEPNVAVQHCILVKEGKTDESWQRWSSTGNGPYVLRGVSYHYQVAADTEFPNDARPPWAIYLRVTGWKAGRTFVLVRVHQQKSENRWQELSRIECATAIPFPEDDDATHDVVFNLPYLRLGGIGLHAITVHFWYDGVRLDENGRMSDEPTDDETERVTEPEEVFNTPKWAFGAVDYFWIVRPS